MAKASTARWMRGSSGRGRRRLNHEWLRGGRAGLGIRPVPALTARLVAERSGQWWRASGRACSAKQRRTTTSDSKLLRAGRVRASPGIGVVQPAPCLLLEAGGEVEDRAALAVATTRRLENDPPSVA